MTPTPELPNTLYEAAFVGNGEMATLMRSHDWPSTPLGAIETWPPSLKTVVGICLSSPVPSCVLWGQKFVLLYNDGYRSLIGDKHPQAFGRPLQENSSEFWPDLHPILEKVLQTGQPAYLANDLQRIDPNQALQAAHDSFSPIFNETGQVAGIFHSAIRTTHNCEATTAQPPETEQPEDSTLKQLRESEAKYRALFESIDQGYCLVEVILNEAGKPVDLLHLEVNPAYERQTGLSNIVGKRALEISPTAVEWMGFYGNVALTGQSAHREYQVKEIGRWFSCYASRVGGEGSLWVGVVFEDITDRKRAEAALRALFSNVSHEFRTPLTLLLSSIQEIAQDPVHPVSPAQRSQLELAQRNGIRLLKLVNMLLDVSRIEADRMEAVYEPTDLATLTTELASLFESAATQAGLQLVIDCPPLPELVYVDRDLWEKIVLNLLSNAFKFTFTGEITVRLRQVDNQEFGELTRAVELTVQDTGIGIAAIELPRLFERFYQAKGTIGRSFEGSGIGLSLVQELVKLHGGTIEVNSVEGEGSCFRVLIPTGYAHLPPDRIRAGTDGFSQGVSERSKNNSSNPPLRSTSTGASLYVEEVSRWLSEDNENVDTLSHSFTPSYAHTLTSSTSRILLVDDNADMRDYLKRLLSERWQVETAANGAIALNLIQQQLPDLVLTDVMMPEMDGFQLLNTLRADPITQSIPIILVSARAGEESTVEGLEAGADDYLIKPFSARELVARVETQLQMSRLRQELSANRFKNEFLMTVTHELQSPLASVLGWARFLQTKSLPPDAMVHALAAIERNATIEAKLIKNLLDVASILSGKLHLKSQIVDLASLVRNVAATFRETAELKHIQLVETISNGVPSNMFADGDRLKQVVANLLENAIKFTPEGGQVTIGLECFDSGVQVSVSDTGIGIHPDFLPHVFDRFTQAEVPSRHTPGGVGIGLAIARHLVELHHGTIRVASEGEGRGATFIVRLPFNHPAKPSSDTQRRER